MKAAAEPARRRRLFTLAALAVALLAPAGAQAYWTSNGLGSGSGNAGTLAAPTNVIGTPGAGTVTLSWSAVTPPGGSGTVSYYVTRDGGNAAGCPTATAPTTVTSCTNSGLAPGIHSYTVTAVWNSWTATSSVTQVTVVIGAPSKLSFTQSPGNTTAGATFTLQPQVTVQDQYGNTVTTDTSSVNLAITTPAGATLTCTANPKAASAGVASFAGCAITKAGSYTLTATDGSLTSAVSGSFTISAGAPVSFTVTNPGTRTAGTAFTVTLTASNDAYGNAPTSYAGTQCITFSGPTASPNGTAPLYPQGSCPAGQSAVTFNASGVGTLAGVTLYDATTSTTLKATDATYGTTGTSGAFAVNGLTTMSTFVLSAATTTPTAGQTDNVTITAGDTYGNLVTSYTGSKNLTFSGPGAIGTYRPTMTYASGTPVNFGSATAITFTNGSATAVMTLYRAQTTYIKVSDGTHINGSGTQVTVSPATMNGLSLAAVKVVVKPNTADNLTVRATDTYGNTAPDYPDGVHNVTFSGASVSGTYHPTVTNNAGTAVNFGATTALNFVNGIASVSGSSNGQMTLYAIERANITVTDGTHTSPVLSIVVSSVTATQVSAGGYHTCALVSGGVQCWGLNDSGQLGNNTTTKSSSPVKVVGVGGTGTLSGITQISSGKYHTCALNSSGNVYCWGQNDTGQLGNNTTTNSTTPVEVKVTNTTYLANITQVSSGGGGSCALRNDKTVWCWGYNPFGQDGDNSSTDRSMAVEVRVSASAFLTNVTQIATGANHTCALTSSGTVYCWGYNVYGEIGNGTIDATMVVHSVATQVLGVGGSGYLTGVSALSSGRFHTCAQMTDGTVYCWGHNVYGELGDGTTTNRAVPVRAGSITTATMVSGGEYHSCAVLADDTAQCWGAAAYGQVGDGTTANTSTPVTVIGPGGYGLLTGIAAISAGGGDINETTDYEHTCALLNDGTVTCWGQNNQGQLGNGTTTMSISPVGVALQ